MIRSCKIIKKKKLERKLITKIHNSTTIIINLVIQIKIETYHNKIKATNILAKISLTHKATLQMYMKKTN